MKSCQIWRLAALSFLILLTMTTLAVASEAVTSAQLEVGIIGKSVKDNAARVNEYAAVNEDDGASPAVDLKVEHIAEKGSVDLDANLMGRDDFDLEIGADLNRIFQFDSSFQVLQHWKDKETLGQLGATMLNDVGGNQPRVGTNLTGTLGADYTTLEEANAQYYSEQSNDYLITRSEFKNEASVQLPMIPNVTIHAGMRVERRDGMEQSITLSKCNACHVEAEGKNINEKTEDFTLGATGKFGIVTIDYEYLNRTFEDNSSLEEYNYLNSGVYRGTVGDAQQLSYSGVNEYSNTPDSEKDSHAIKARVDLPRNTVFTGSYIKADIESEKDASIDDGDTYSFVGDNELTSEYTGYTGKLATRIGPFKLAASANVYEIDGPEYTLTFPDRDEITVDPYASTQTYHSAESREVEEFGLDAVYRLGLGSTLRLSYDYENVEREEEELGETETHSYKAAVHSRISRQMSVRGSYEYQDISEPLKAHTGIGQVSGTFDPAYPGLAVLNTADFKPTPDPTNDTVYYWTAVYPNRELDATNLPEDVHEMKVSANWSPKSNLSATFFARYRTEENSNVKYEKDLFVPGVSFWYAPNGKMNLTMAYTFNKMETENRMCVGWYHG